MFMGTWRIGEHQPGAQALSIHATVDTRRRQVSGSAEMYYDYPDKSFRSIVNGHYDPVTIQGHGPGVQITLYGHLPIYLGQSAASDLQNLRVTIILGPAWKTGTATYSYLEGGDWKTYHSLPVVYEPGTSADTFTETATAPE